MSLHLRGVKPAVGPDADALTRVPPAPRFLSAQARDEWKRVLPQLIARQIITRADLAGVESYCMAVGTVRQIAEAFAAAGGLIDPKLFGVQNRAMQTARQLAAEYGLTPTSRARIGSNTREDDGDNPLAVG